MFCVEPHEFSRPLSFIIFARNNEDNNLFCGAVAKPTLTPLHTRRLPFHLSWTFSFSAGLPLPHVCLTRYLCLLAISARTHTLLLIAISQVKNDGERRSSAIAGTGDGPRGRGGGVGGGRGGDEEPIESELRLPEYEGPFSDYSAIVLQYGFITMFASALPIVTFFAIAEVLLQIRTDRSVRAFLLVLTASYLRRRLLCASNAKHICLYYCWRW